MTGEAMQAGAVARLRGFFGKRSDPYAGADMEIVVRLAPLAWIVNAVVAVVVFPLAPPTLRLGVAGWAVAGLALAFSWAAVARLRRRSASTGHDELLVLSYAGVLQVWLLQFLTGGNGSPLVALYLLWAIYTGAVHPPRRVVAFLGFVGVAATSSLAYDGWDRLAAATLGVELVLWFTLALMATLWTSGVRAQRLGLTVEGEEARRTARTDALTGVENRLAFDEVLDQELERAAGTRQPLSMILVDLDGFKEINDRYGHLNGDEILRNVAAGLQAVLRQFDRCFRWGGDEFVVLLPATDHAGAEDLAVRLHNSVRTTCLTPGGEPMTITTGSTEFAAGMSRDDLVGAADLALMGAKARASTPRLQRED